jgi:hypothetical protein
LEVFKKFCACCWLYNWTAKIADIGKSKDLCRLLVPRSQTYDTLCDPCTLPPYHYPSHALLSKNASPSMLHASRRELPQLKGLKTVNPALMRNVPTLRPLRCASRSPDLVVNASCLAQRALPQLKGLETIDPALSCRSIPFRSISTSLCTTIGRSQYHLSIVDDAAKS